MPSPERVRVMRWVLALGTVALLLALWRLFLLFCPTREWSVLWWSLEARTEQTWNRPEIPALVAENAVENGGPVGEAVGRILYRRTLVGPQGATAAGLRPAPYAKVHLQRAWLGTRAISWSTKRFAGHALLVRVFVQADLPHRVPFGRSCFSTEPLLSLIERDYVVVPTGRGWRVAGVYTVHAGGAMAMRAAVGAGTAAAVLAGC